MEKRSIKKIFRKLESSWEGDLIDKRKKHRRKTIAANKGRVRQFLKIKSKRIEDYV